MMKVGKASTFNSFVRADCSPPSISTSVNLFAEALTSESITGFIFLHGGHQTARTSTSTTLSVGINDWYSLSVSCFTGATVTTGLLSLFHAAMPPFRLYAWKPFSFSHLVAALLLPPLRQ